MQRAVTRCRFAIVYGPDPERREITGEPSMIATSAIALAPADMLLAINAAIEMRRPLLISSSPGIGKTSLVEQGTAARPACDLIVSHPAVEDPTVPGGMPWIQPGADHASFFAFGALHRAKTATRETVWLLDDLGQASPAVQAAYMQLLLSRCVGEHRIPDCVTFIACTNRRVDRSGVSGILEAVKSRFVSLLELKTDLKQWSRWFLAQPYAVPEAVAFLRFVENEKESRFCNFNPTADLTNSPSPRTWVSAVQWLNRGLPRRVEFAGVAGAIGESVATEFFAFLDMFKMLPSIDEIILNPDKAPIPTNMSALIATATALAHRANDKNFARVAIYLERVVAEKHAETAVMCVQDAVRREPSIQRTQAFIKLQQGEIGDLFRGEEN